MLYSEFGQRIHETGSSLDVAMCTEVLETLALDPALIGATEDEAWDRVIRESHQEGIAPVGNDVGTPIVQLRDDSGAMRGFFGPIISPVPVGDDALRLWDAVSTLASSRSFFELKRPHGNVPSE